jgi:cytoskeletal protein RodZ
MAARQPPEPPEPTEPQASNCPRCGAPLHADQDWCLECGAPARTRLAPTPNWHIPAALLAVIVLLAGVGLAIAFVELTKDAPPAVATTAAPAPAEGGAPAVPTTPPVTTAVPTETVTTPAETTTAPTTTTPPATTTRPTRTQTTPTATTTTPQGTAPTTPTTGAQ